MFISPLLYLTLFFLSFFPLSFLISSSSPPPGCSQLVLETYNVPELSAGVNCTFEDLSEMDGLVVGNQIQCYSPAAKEVPRIITENGEQSWVVGSSSCLHRRTQDRIRGTTGACKQR
jgi:hypothetical protein